MPDFLTLDGSYGEGGGQILRTALSLSLIAMRPFRLFNIRAGRRHPGLLPQHLSAVRAAAAISGAEILGDQLGSMELVFNPTHGPKPGSYAFDVADAAPHGSAGSVTLILQTVLVPLACADGASQVVLRGGTHVEWSPPFDDVVNSYFPTLHRMGFRAKADLIRWGWYPIGGGEICCRIVKNVDGTSWPKPIEAAAPGRLRKIVGRAVTANLPSHISQRMAERARLRLADLDVPTDIAAEQVSAACPGAAVLLTAEYEGFPASFSAYGRLGKPSEKVADEAVAALHEHHASKAAIELHLADQLLVPLALAPSASTFTVARQTSHLTTNAWTIGRFGLADISITGEAPFSVRVEPRRKY